MFFICQGQQSPYLSKLNATRCKMDTEYKEYSNPTMTLQTVWVYHGADDQSVSKICTRQQNIYAKKCFRILYVFLYQVYIEVTKI